MIIVPSGISGKAAKKFRKDARRRFRLEGEKSSPSDGADAPSQIRFRNEGDEEESEEEEEEDGGDDDDDDEKEEEVGPPSKKRKKEKNERHFPRINNLIAASLESKRLAAESESKRSEINSLPTSVKSNYVALDCEMVGIGSGGKTSALARASLVGWDGNVMLDTFVSVPDRVTDFRTFVSGVRAKDIRPRGGYGDDDYDNGKGGGGVGDDRDKNGDIASSKPPMELHECRRVVGEMLRDRVLVGHALRTIYLR